jgi:hypothetical protein
MDGHKSETWQAQRLAVRRSFFTRCRNMGSDLPPKLNGTFLLLTGNGISLTALGLFSFSRLLLSFFSYPAFERLIPLLRLFPLRPLQQLVSVYSVLRWTYENISALNARVSTFFRYLHQRSPSAKLPMNLSLRLATSTKKKGRLS